MSTDSLMGKSLGSRISTHSLMGKYLGYSLYVLFAFTHHVCTSTPVLTFYSLIYCRGAAHFLGWRQHQTVLGYTRIQSYNKKQIYDLGEWWDLRGTISMRRLGRQPGTHTINNCIVFVFGFTDTIWRKQLMNYLQDEKLVTSYWKLR